MKNYKKHYLLFSLFACLVFPTLVKAAGGGNGHGDQIAPVILGVTAVLFFAVLGRFIARKLNQPSVLGELLTGVIIGNVFYWFGVKLFILLREGPEIFNIIGQMLAGHQLSHAITLTLGNRPSAEVLTQLLRQPDGLDLLKVVHVIDIFSRYGVIFMLFLVGLETSLDDLRRTGADSIKVAVLGVILPMLFGFIAARLFMPDLSIQTDLFIAAAMAATSISVTARVLQEMNKMQTPEAHVILGAAVFDDILGLIFLAVITSLIVSGSIEVQGIVKVIALAGVYLASVVLVGPMVLKFLVRLMHNMNVLEAKLFCSFIFLMLLAWLASAVDLATIIGAFAAGIILHDGYFHRWGEISEHSYSIKDLVAPLESILAPIFFVLVGIQVKLETFFSWRVIVVSFGLIIAAILGKLLSGFVASRKSNRLAIGIGMIPRGEVGLVFAAIGKNMGVISDQLFSSIILMVIVTTLIAPPWLKYRFVNGKKKVKQ